MEINIGAFLADAISNMQRYWLNRTHFAYTVEFHTGVNSEEFVTPHRCGITIMKTLADEPWMMTLEIPWTNEKTILGKADDIDGVWNFFTELQKKYPV